MKKIMFSDRFDLTRLVLTGRKTMTRRILRYPKKFKGVEDVVLEFHKRPGTDFYYDCVVCDNNGYSLGQLPLPYDVGDIVAISQNYKAVYDELEEWFGNEKANAWWCELCDYIGDGLGPAVTPGYKNKMFVRADFMPHHICFTDLKFERLQDISEEDCLREGIYEYFPYIYRNPEDRLKSYRFSDTQSKFGYYQLSPVRDCFAVLINRISGRGTWESNPWVAAYTFELRD